MPRKPSRNRRSATKPAARTKPAAKPTASQDAGYIEVRVGRVPGRFETIALNGERTVGAALKIAGLTQNQNEELRVNRTAATIKTSVTSGDTIMLLSKVSGN